MLELVRYIHLNPLRAKTVKSQIEFDKYPYNWEFSVVLLMKNWHKHPGIKTRRVTVMRIIKLSAEPEIQLLAG